MKRALLLAALGIANLSINGMAAASGDPERGKQVFKRCATCHAVGASARNKTGPVLNDLFGRAAGSVEGYRYSKLNRTAGELGLIWTPETMAAYLPDATKFLKTFIRDAGEPSKARGRSKMAYRLRNSGDVADVIAYLQQFSNNKD